MDLTESEIRAQQASNRNRRASMQSRSNAVGSRLNQVRAAKNQIARLKVSANETNSVFNQLDFKDTNEWYGLKRNTFEERHADGKQVGRNYYSGLDDLADDLETAERRLVQEQHNYDGIMRDLDNTWLWLKEQWNRLFN